MKGSLLQIAGILATVATLYREATLEVSPVDTMLMVLLAVLLLALSHEMKTREAAAETDDGACTPAKALKTLLTPHCAPNCEGE